MVKCGVLISHFNFEFECNQNPESLVFLIAVNAVNNFFGTRSAIEERHAIEDSVYGGIGPPDPTTYSPNPDSVHPAESLAFPNTLPRKPGGQL